MNVLKLHCRLPQAWDAEPFVVRLAADGARPGDNEALLTDMESPPSGFRAYLLRSGAQESAVAADLSNVCRLPEALDYLQAGDIVRISPRSGELWVMYRRESCSNSMLLTEQCNSNCLMCSQPPKSANDRHLVRAYLDAIPLMSPETPELGITGGEPTLLGDDLFQVIAACRDSLPYTALHMLSNGRMFNYLSLCQELARLSHPDFMIGIPVYSDLATQHDFVVQAAGAFDQTLRGIMNLERCGLRVEIRVVLHRQTFDRLPQLAQFLARNLPFVEHVALMGLEMMGYVRMNLDALWIDPAEYQCQLAEAVHILDQHHLNVSIYNHQLCVLDRALWPFARKSISDWKNEYLNECRSCAALDQCGGFFSSAHLRRSDHIRPLSPLESGCSAVAGPSQFATA